MKPRQIATLAVALLIPLTPLGVAAAPKSNHAITESGKKPGKTCHSLGPGSTDFKNCIQTQAHTGQKPKKP